MDLEILKLLLLQQEKHMRVECTACGILKAERVLKARPEKLIGALDPKLGRVVV